MEDYSMNEVEEAKVQLGFVPAVLGRDRGSRLVAPEPAGHNASLPDAFVNDTDPHRTLQTETYIHRLIVTLAATGLNQREIAQRLDCAASTVSVVLRQPWARTRLINMMHEAGRDELKTLLAPAATDAVLNIIEIANDANVKANVRLCANQEILDRFMGRATQPIMRVDAPPDKLKDAELIQQIRDAQSGAS